MDIRKFFYGLLLILHACKCDESGKTSLLDQNSYSAYKVNLEVITTNFDDSCYCIRMFKRMFKFLDKPSCFQL